MHHDIITNIREHGPHPLYVLHGDDYLVKDVQQRIVAEVLPPESLLTNLIVFDGAALDVSRLAAEVLTPSLFGDERVIVVEHTALFMSRKVRTRVVDRVVAAWGRGEHSAAIRGFGQLLRVAGLEPADLASSSDWVSTVTGGPAGSEDAETLLQVAAAFQEQGAPAGGGSDEEAVMDLIQSSFPKGTVLIFTAEDVDRRKKLFKEAGKRGQVVECAAQTQRYGSGLDRAFFEEWVGATLDELGKTMTSAAMKKLRARSGQELRQLRSELEKLAAFVGERSRISPEDVDAVFEDMHEAAFFELSAAARRADLTECLAAVHENLKISDHPLQSLAALATDFRRLIVARELLFSELRGDWTPRMTYMQFKPVLAGLRERRPKPSPKDRGDLLVLADYAVYSYLQDCQKFTMERLAGIMEAILEADVLIKSTRIGGTSPSVVLEQLMMKICADWDSQAVYRKP